MSFSMARCGAKKKILVDGLGLLASFLICPSLHILPIEKALP